MAHHAVNVLCYLGVPGGGGGKGEREQTSRIDPMVNQHWPTFSDAEPKLFQHQWLFSVFLICGGETCLLWVASRKSRWTAMTLSKQLPITEVKVYRLLTPGDRDRMSTSSWMPRDLWPPLTPSPHTSPWQHEPLTWDRLIKYCVQGEDCRVEGRYILTLILLS